MLLLLAAVPCQAHELGQNEAAATIKRDGTYVINVRVDPEAVMQRLEFAAGLELSEGLTPEQQERRMLALEPQLRQNIDVLFDGRAQRPSIRYIPRSREKDKSWGLLELSGTLPQNAKQLQFRYGLVFTNYPLKLIHEGDEKIDTTWVEGNKLSAAMPIRQHVVKSHAETFRQYVILGYEHILPKGLDHILFVLGIFLLSTRWKPLLAQVTAFTIAHSITLGLAMYGLVSLPSRVVEPLIALSIVYVAVENIATRKLHSWRIAVVFLFGLLHGMGFAGVLSDLGLPRERFATALVAFNVGVELGQLSVIAIAFLALASWARRREWYRARVVIPASIVIALIGAYWSIQRLS